MASSSQHTSLTPREFTLQYLGQITDNFSEDHIIGQGEHGVVYKGVLNSGEEITLKKLYHMPELDDTQFRNELNNLVRAQHQNIVGLVGYCSNLENKRVKHDDEYTSAVVEERFLCFEYLQGGSLEKYILDESCALDWHTCFKIIKGICEGLNYLHNGTDDRILHLNLKPSNILLDKNMMPKIGDFGLSRLFPSAQSYVTAEAIERTWQPLEYIDKGQTTSKFDIFSLGLIVIQLMSRFIGFSCHPDMPSQEFFYLVRLNWEKQLAAMTPCDTSGQVRACIEIALRCLEDDQMRRPAIADIVNELNKINTIGSSFTGEAEMEDRCSKWLQAAMELPVSASLGPIGPMFQKLHSFKATKESLPAGINEGDIQSFKKELEKLCISLMDLLETNDTSFTAKYWMKEVREVCYDTENCFDKLIMQSNNGSSVHWICKLLKRRPQIAIDFSTLVARVADARERRGRFLEWNIDKENVEHECGQASTTPDIASSSTLSLQPPVPVAGLRRSELTLKLSVPAVAHMDDLVNLLAFDDQKQKQLKVVSIFGFAGAGKTTVARTLYRKFGGKFHCRAFIRMSRQPDIRRLLTSMLSQIKAPLAHAFADVQVLVASIRKHLEHKRYFVIIDELWTPSVWNTVRRAFPDGNCCSRVITTTQIEDAALACCSYQSKYIFKMRLVTDYQSRELFSTGVSDSGSGYPQDFKELSYGVITTSGGLPLATVNIGSISEPNLIREQWEQIKDSLDSTLSANPTCEVMEEVLNLIYNSLPRHLKTCLLYFNMYPEGYTVWKDVLVRQWISEDFIRVTRKKEGFIDAVKQQDTEEDEVEEKVRVAQGYFAELAGRGMIQAVDTDDKGEVLSCTVHHMVLDLIRCKSMEENFITTVDKFPSTLVLPDMVRRLSVQFGDAKVANIPENMVSSQVRSLLYFGSFECAPSTGDYGFLRVLNLHIWADQDKTFDLTAISELFRLKYLKVKSNITINLPAKVQMLQNMETLQVDAPLSVVPSDIFALKSLLHLCLPCQVYLPDGIVHMTSLRSLGDFSLCSNSAENVLGLGKLIKLWDLRVTCSAVKPDSLVGNMKHFSSILGEFKELKSLIMDSDTSNLSISCESLSNASCAPALLERFEFPRTCIFPSLPKWFGYLQKLCILKVAVRETSMENMDILKGLHALTTLSICVFVAPKERIVFGEEGFTLLRTFKFTSAALSLAFTVGAMPKLETLKLRFDANKSEQHDLRHAGINNLLGLKEISANIGISGDDEMESEAALLIDIFRTHPSSPIFNVQSVDRTFDEKITVGYAEEQQTTETQDVRADTMLFDSRSFVTPDTSSPMQNLEEDEDKTTHPVSALESTHTEDRLITSGILEEGLRDQRAIQEKDPREDDNTEAHSWTSPPPSSTIAHPQDPGEDEDKVTHTESAMEDTFSKLPKDHLITSDISEEGFNDQRGIQEKGPREDDNTEAQSWTSPPPGSVIAHPQDPEFKHISMEAKESKKDEISLGITVEDATERPSPERVPQTNQMATSNKGSGSKLYELKEQLLLLASLVATVTYLSGLNLPGGDWQQQEDGHLADISRYRILYSLNATAFASSVMVCLILVMLRRNIRVWTKVLLVGMLIDLLAIIGSYGAGACRDAFTTIWAGALACAVLTYIACAFILYYLNSLTSRRDNTTVPTYTNTGYPKKEKIEVLMLLATFTFTISYAAGLNPPGGFWSSTQHQKGGGHLLHLAGNPIMQDTRRGRYRAFFICNTVALIASLLLILLLLANKVRRVISARFVKVYGLIAVALLGLMGAYAAGSSRETDKTVTVIISLSTVIPACVGLQLALNYVFHWKPIKNMRDTFSQWSKKPSPAGDSALANPVLKNNCYLAMVLASFAVCITYQAGLDPPGGLWQDNLDGHEIGHPVLRTTHPARYQVFFYSNSAAFVTSLVLVMMVQSKFLLTIHTLEACMVLDLIFLVTAYTVGSTRTAQTSVYVLAVIGLILIYIVVHVSAVVLKENVVAEPVPVPPVVAPAATTFAPAAARRVVGGRSKEQLGDNGQVLRLIAILAAALTYQAGLSPPGGFWLADDEQLGHRAGYPVLLDNYPRRYSAFFYCNAVSFMASVAVILLLVNQKLYGRVIRGYALHACMALGMYALMSAYASGSYRHFKTSIYMLTMVVAVVLLPVCIFSFNRFVRLLRYRILHQVEPKTRQRRRERAEKDEQLEYLMLLGLLAASVTYQSGLRPPGGVWQEDSATYSAGDPMLFDINKRRYDIFFYSNSTSFMASVVAIVMLLPLTLNNLERLRHCLPFHTGDLKWALWPVHAALLLDMLGLLVAYVVGSTRNWESSRNVTILFIPVLVYILAYAMAIFIRNKQRRSPQQSSTQTDEQMRPEV
ncbi:hypothetical protein ACQJBY_013859 [Aegilops geniculata]